MTTTPWDPRRVLAILAKLAMLAGCSGGSQLQPKTLPDAGSLSDPGTSWMAADVAKKNLLYVSDEGANDGDVYSWPRGQLVGKLTGLAYPQGECVDKTGNVFITTLGTSTASYIFEYPHGGTKPTAKIKDSGYDASGCSVDPTTGNLAVTNLEGSNGSGGNLAIYNKAGRFLGYYADTYIGYFFFCGYDNVGNLFVDGARDYNPFDGFAFAELQVGSSGFTDITLNQTVNYPGGAQWDGKNIAVGDTDESVIYRFNISGIRGTEIGSTPLGGASYVLQFWIQGNKVVGPNAGAGNAMIWNYPAGGAATKALGGLTDPVGSVVSLARRNEAVWRSARKSLAADLFNGARQDEEALPNGTKRARQP